MTNTSTPVETNRHQRRHSEELPLLLTKKQVAELLQCSGRQVELMAKAGRLPAAVYLAERSPRWKRDALLTFIENAGGGQ